LALVALCASVSEAAEVEIRVQGSGGRALQIAVQQFSADDFSSHHVEPFEREVSGGLERSSVFAVVDPDAFLEPRQSAELGAFSLRCDNWKGIGADALLQGRIERLRGGRVRVRYRIWDVQRCSLQGAAGYLDAPEDRVWVAARRLADEVVRRFTGVRGVASTQIAFVSDKSGNKEIYLMESDGSRRQMVTRNGNINLFPAWSPDADSLVYTSYRGGAPDLWTVSRGSSRGGRLLDVAGEKYRAVFGPLDGQVTVVMYREGNTDLFLARRNGRELRRLTRSRAIDVSPTWSPDGSRLAFASDRSGTQQIYVRDMASGDTRRLTFEGKYNASPAWSPNGDWIAYAARTGNSFDLYLVDPDSGYTRPLVIHPRTDEAPAWSPDGRKVAFTSSRRGRRDLYTVDVDGRNVRRITRDFGNCSSPSWSPWRD
jgi:TolB protein